MAISFKQFAINEDHIVVLGPLPTTDNVTEQDEWFLDLNDEFARTFEHPVLTPDIGYRRLREILTASGIEFPMFVNPMDPLDGEYIYILEGTQPWFLYTAYTQLESGSYDFYVEIMSEAILSDFLANELGDEPMDTEPAGIEPTDTPPMDIEPT